MEKRRPILTVRPKFDSGLAMLQALGAMAAGSPVVTLGLGTVFFILFMMIGLGKHVTASGVYGFFFGISILGIPPLVYEVKKRALQRTMYNFYDDYMDFQYFHFFVNRRRGRVRYADISDIQQHASAVQEHRRLTTIYIYVPGMGLRERGFSGVRLVDLPQAKDYMTKIMEVLERRGPAMAPIQGAGAPVAPQQPPAMTQAPEAQPPAPPAVTQAPVVPASPASPPPVTES